MPITLVVRLKEFGRLLSHFQSAQTDVTVSFAPGKHRRPPPVACFAGGFETDEAKPPRTRRETGYRVSATRTPRLQTLQTSISLDTAEDAVLRYEHAVSRRRRGRRGARDGDCNRKT